MDQPADLVRRQLDAIEAFHRARRASEAALERLEKTREVRMDVERRRDVRRREHEALVARAHEQLRMSGELLMRPSVARAVVAYRHPWFTDKVVELLRRAGAEVLAVSDNGAEAIGMAVAEQPDLVLVEESLLMVPSEEVVRETRRYCERTVIGVQVPHSGRIGLMLDAGASTVSTRQVPPHDVVQQALALVRR